ncbi:MAG: hypothetical protein AAF349_10135 [Cyanobacteria bacterium P01_A01_bin.68]
MSVNFGWRILDIQKIQNLNTGYQVIEIITFADLEVSLKLSLCDAFF